MWSAKLQSLQIIYTDGRTRFIINRLVRVPKNDILNEGFHERWCWEKKKKKSNRFWPEKIPKTNLLKIQGWGHTDISHICSYAAKKNKTKKNKGSKWTKIWHTAANQCSKISKHPLLIFIKSKSAIYIMRPPPDGG